MYPSHVDSQYEVPQTDHGYLGMRHIPVNLEPLKLPRATTHFNYISKQVLCWQDLFGVGTVKKQT